MQRYLSYSLSVGEIFLEVTVRENVNLRKKEVECQKTLKLNDQWNLARKRMLFCLISRWG